MCGESMLSLMQSGQTTCAATPPLRMIHGKPAHPVLVVCPIPQPAQWRTDSGSQSVAELPGRICRPGRIANCRAPGQAGFLLHGWRQYGQRRNRWQRGSVNPARVSNLRTAALSPEHREGRKG